MFSQQLEFVKKFLRGFLTVDIEGIVEFKNKYIDYTLLLTINEQCEIKIVYKKYYQSTIDKNIDYICNTKIEEFIDDKDYLLDIDFLNLGRDQLYEILNIIYDEDTKTIPYSIETINKLLKRNSYNIEMTLSELYDKEKEVINMNEILSNIYLYSLIDSIISYDIIKYNICYMCEQPLECTMPKLAVCNSDLCLFKLEKYCHNIELPNYHVMNLLINLALWYLASTRSQEIFSKDKISNVEFCDKLKNIDENIFNECKSNTYKEIIQLMVRAQGCGDKKLTEYYTNLKDTQLALKKLYSIIRMCIDCDGVIYELPNRGKKYYKYKILSNTPEQEYLFQQRKTEFSSFNSYHGSGAHNWLSILLGGLQNMSNTKYQTSGAAYGKGVYSAAEIGTALGYSPVCVDNKGKNINIIGILEIIDNPKGITTKTPYYVVHDTSLIALKEIYYCF